MAQDISDSDLPTVDGELGTRSPKENRNTESDTRFVRMMDSCVAFH
jgi:hypothetical protein